MSDAPPSPWLTTEDIKKYLGGISDATLSRYRRAGLPVHYVLPRSPRYHRDEVDAWIRQAGEVDR